MGARFARGEQTQPEPVRELPEHLPRKGSSSRRGLVSAVSPATSSLTRDLIAGRRTEVEAVLADLAARARTAGTATPLIDLAVLALRIHNRQIGS